MKIEAAGGHKMNPKQILNPQTPFVDGHEVKQAAKFPQSIAWMLLPLFIGFVVIAFIWGSAGLVK